MGDAEGLARQAVEEIAGDRLARHAEDDAARLVLRDVAGELVLRREARAADPRGPVPGAWFAMATTAWCSTGRPHQ